MVNNVDEKYENGKVYDVSVSDLIPGSNQPRSFFCPDAMEELKQSIGNCGLIHPITVTHSPVGKLTIVAGERRWRVHKALGMSLIKATYVNSDVAAAITLAENFQREDLNAIEKAECIYTLKNQHGYSLAQTASIVGKSLSSVSELLSLIKLPENIKSECRLSPRYVLTRLIQIAKAPTLSDQKSFLMNTKTN